MKLDSKKGFTQAPNPVKDIFSNIFAFRSVKKVNLVRGFTLIELLVVVAIIGILASLVIASLNQARSRGVDAAIKGTMSSIRAQAEIIYDSDGNYDDVCEDGSIAETLIADVESKNGGVTVSCISADQEWFAETVLVTEVDGNPQYFCVDYTGYAGNSTGDATDACVPN